MREVLEVRLGYQSNWYTLKMDVQREGGGKLGGWDMAIVRGNAIDVDPVDT